MPGSVHALRLNTAHAGGSVGGPRPARPTIEEIAEIRHCRGGRESYHAPDSSATMSTPSELPASIRRYNRFLLLVAGLGGLLYGIDVGIIAGALPYLDATSGLNPGQLSIIVAAVLLGSVISTLFAGMLSEALGRKPMMILSGLLFVASIPMIALAHGFVPIVLGRLLQGISAGFVGVVVPLYLAECLGASNRGKGTGIFQWLLTLGIVIAAVIAYVFSLWISDIDKVGDSNLLFVAKDFAWRWIFWISILPGIVYVFGALVIAESPRWLFKRGKVDAARAALLRSGTAEAADNEIAEMTKIAAEEASKVSSTGERIKESLLARKYVIPFVLACIILACNQATGINSIIGYNATILIQAGLSDAQAHMGYVILTVVNFTMTIGAVALVDKKGRKFLLSLGTAGIIIFLIGVGALFHRTESKQVECKKAAQAKVEDYQDVKVAVAPASVKVVKTPEISLSVAGKGVTKAVAKGGKIELEFDKPLASAELVLSKEGKGEKVEYAYTGDEANKHSFGIEDTLVKGAAVDGGKLVIDLGYKGSLAHWSWKYPYLSTVQDTNRTDFDVTDATIMADRKFIVPFNNEAQQALLGEGGFKETATMNVIYSCGDFTSAANVVRSDDKTAKVRISRNDSLPSNKVDAFFKNPFADLTKSKDSDLQIDNALITPVPSATNGWLTAICIFIAVGFFAVGPGVCVWLALSELMPTRIRSNGMSIALLLNQMVSTTIAAVFLPTVGKYGYSTMFFGFAACTVIYFITAAFFLPETKGKTLEEIEEHFEGKKAKG